VSLKIDQFDPEPILAALREDLFYTLGKPIMRMAGPEMEAFIEYSVRDALGRAFSAAESLYIGDMVKRADQSSRSMLEAVMAGAEIGRRKRGKK
jgi:hypothetical protein